MDTFEEQAAAAAAALDALEAEVARLEAELDAATVKGEQAAARAHDLAVEREDAAARGDLAGAEEVRQKVAVAAGEANLAVTTARGLARRLADVHGRLPEAAFGAAVALLAELEGDLAASRRRLDEPDVDEAAVEGFVEAFRRAYSLRQECFRVSGNDMRFNPGSFDARSEIARRGFAGLAPAYVTAPNVGKPPLVEPWRARLGPYLRRYQADREREAALAVRAARRPPVDPALCPLTRPS